MLSSVWQCREETFGEKDQEQVVERQPVLGAPSRSWETAEEAFPQGKGVETSILPRGERSSPEGGKLPATHVLTCSRAPETSSPSWG